MMRYGITFLDSDGEQVGYARVDCKGFEELCSRGDAMMHYPAATWLWEELPVLGNRVEALRSMDALVRSMNDESLVETWLMGGVPDGADHDDLVEIASDDTCFGWCVDCFCRLMRSDAFRSSGFAL